MISIVGSFGRPDLQERRPELFDDEACGIWALVPVGLSGALGAPLDTSLGSLTPDTHAWVLKVIDGVAAQGVQLRVRSTLRSCKEQHELFLIGRVPVVNPKIQVTKADGCISWHVLGRAVDFDVMDPSTGKPTKSDAPYEVLGSVAKGLGGKWGGDFPGFRDIGHVEYHPGRTIEQACPNPQACEATQAKELGGDQPPPAPPSEGDPPPQGLSTSAKVVIGSLLVGGVVAAGYQLSRRR
jgi:hypothetical protein